MLDENALRRPDFLPGRPIRLADGQRWTFPLPPGEHCPGVGDGAAQEEVGTLFGYGYSATLAAVLEAADEFERLQAELALAIFLLGRNYDLSPVSFQEILCFEKSDPSLAAMQAVLHNVTLEHIRFMQPDSSDDAAPEREADTPSTRERAAERRFA